MKLDGNMRAVRKDRIDECGQNNGEKLEALLETAKAYYNRGTWIQYDELSMDRVLRITPRRCVGATPEEATRQHTVYLDCSSFIWSVFKHAFDYELPADITWEMIDLVQPRVFYYEVTHRETPNDQEEIKAEFVKTLQPGDVLVTEYEKNGHVMLFLGDGRYMHCTSAGIPSSYDYTGRTDHFHNDAGGIHVGNSVHWYEQSEDEILSRSYLFRPTMKRFCILRPLACVGLPTEAARARIGACRDLVCAVESIPMEKGPVKCGKRIVYTVRVRNVRQEKANVMISFTAPSGTETEMPCGMSFVLQAGEEIAAEFPVVIQEIAHPCLNPPMVSVNGLQIASPVVSCAYVPGELEIGRLTETVKARIANGDETLLAASAAYGEQGVPLNPDLQALLAALFYRRDSVAGNILIRKWQKPQQGMAADALFGGYGVITPEVVYDTQIRCRRVRREDLQPGDIVVCCDDAYMKEAYACYYTGDALYGKVDAHGKVQEICGDEIDTYLGTLFGRFCFIVIRPYLAKEWKGM